MMLEAKRTTRRDPRYRVRLAVNYRAGDDFDTDYSENISRGGLFLRSAHHLSQGEEIEIELELPGSFVYNVGARVAYTLSPHEAAGRNHPPGAGLMLTESPPGFQAALAYYLSRLERRGDFVVLAADNAYLKPLEDAGYRARLAPPPARLMAAVNACEAPVIGVVVPRRQHDDYLRAAAPAGEEGLIFAVDYLEELDESLARFDLGF